MNYITLDFLHGYSRGDRRPSDSAAYQWDLGNALIAKIPATADDIEVHYWQAGYGESMSYMPNDATTADGVTTITANLPNYFFENASELRVYIVATSTSQAVTHYEGRIVIASRPKPEDYVDDHPEGGAIPYVQAAKMYSEEAEAWARGTVDSTDVPSTADQYHNNSKYFKELAEAAKDAAETAATNAGAAETSAAASASAAAAIVTVANDGMVVTDDDDEYAVTFAVSNGRIVATFTLAES